MKTINVFFASILVLFPLSLGGQEMSDKQLIEAIKEDPYRAAGGHHPYEPLSYADTKAPEGYTAFYVSHYGRHGSRYQGDVNAFKLVLPDMDKMASKGYLTPKGDSLRVELHRMMEAHKGNLMLLTQKGSAEHRGIAERLARRVPSVFNQADKPDVACVSTTAQRCIQSMANFATAVKGAHPSVNVIYNVGIKPIAKFATVDGKTIKKNIKAVIDPVQDSLLQAMKGVDEMEKAFFKDTVVSRRFIFNLFEAAQGAGCLDIDVDPLKHFTAEQLFELWKIRNIYFCAFYGSYNATEGLRNNPEGTARLIVNEADAAIEGNSHCADLRFGHDGGVGPLADLLKIEEFSKPTPLYAPHNVWQSWRYIQMGTNIQLIFYKRGVADDILVKVLFNEKEVKIPALNSFEGPYYKWADLRRYILVKIGDIRELPAYYSSYASAKAAEIKRLQAGESDGFYFWTDTHFPANSGNAAPLMEYLQHNTKPRKVFFGGDMIAGSVKGVKEGKDLQISAFMQLRGVSEGLYPIRGNHDITSSTKKKAVSRETFSQWKTAEYFKQFTSRDAVFNETDDMSDYYYIDEPSAKIRYIVFDTTDSVYDGKVSYGIGIGQMRWIIEKAILSTPENWNIFFLSHFPMSKDHATLPSIIKAGECIEALASHTVFEFEGRTYDFGRRADLEVLMTQNGHRHGDIESAVGKVLNVMTSCDAKRDYLGFGTPLSGMAAPKKDGTKEEQTFDYVSISADKTLVSIIRIGAGHNRYVNVIPVKCTVGDKVKLSPRLKGGLRWAAYDGVGNKTPRVGTSRMLQTVSDVAVIDGKGRIEALKQGISIAVACDRTGNKEFFLVEVR